MIRRACCAGFLVALVFAVSQLYLAYSTAEEFQAYKAKTLRDAAAAESAAVENLKSTLEAYHRRLQEAEASRQRIARAYNEAMRDLEAEKQRNAEFRRWAGERLPSVVVERLRNLRAGGENTRDEGVSD